MDDNPQVAAIRSRINEVREKANSFSARFKDSEGPKLVRQMVFNHLDDAEGMLRDAAAARLSNPRWESMWTSYASMMVDWATNGLLSLQQQVAPYGGPENVEFFPKSR